MFFSKLPVAQWFVRTSDRNIHFSLCFRDKYTFTEPLPRAITQQIASLSYDIFQEGNTGGGRQSLQGL